MIAAINFALFEDRILDRVTGQMVNPNMEWYLLAGMSDVPKIDIMLNNMPERGVIGIGEPPTVSTASAIANAVRNATGATIRSLPLHPHKVLAALEQEKAGGTNCEGLCLRQPREREGSGRRAEGRRHRAADRRRPGPARADEGLHRLAGSPRQRQRARRDGHVRRRTAG